MAAPQVPYVQIAEIEIDPARLAAYTAAVKDQIETAIRVEPDVLVLYAVSDNVLQKAMPQADSQD